MDRCTDCDGGIIEFSLKYCGKPRDLFDLCVRHNVILSEKDCDNCGKPSVLDFNQKLWRCQKLISKGKKKKRKCSWKQSVFKNTFFDNAHLDIETILIFVNAYVREFFSYVFVRSELKISDPSICDWASFCREVLIEWCLKREGPIGGEGKIVEVDESKFGKRKYNVGRLIEGQWVFGGVCRETREFFMVPVQQRDSATLLGIIKDRILPGTTIISDCWKAYNCLQDEGYTHLTVNHSVNFVDPNNKATHTNNIERLWREAKKKSASIWSKEKALRGIPC